MDQILISYSMYMTKVTVHKYSCLVCF